MIDLFMDASLLDNVKKTFSDEIGTKKYFSILPKDQKPPVNLNRDEMEKWRPLMEKYYIKEKVQWS